jgi:hypothetical protein
VLTEKIGGMVFIDAVSNTDQTLAEYSSKVNGFDDLREGVVYLPRKRSQIVPEVGRYDRLRLYTGISVEGLDVYAIVLTESMNAPGDLQRLRISSKRNARWCKHRILFGQEAQHCASHGADPPAALLRRQ